MANFVRRIVSGNKARFHDTELNLELDLVYVTDHLIIMGYPASAFEGIYRNRREDAKKFLDHRHKSNYWLFNFCPIQENSYPASAFEGRVSRYPFPDHHSPPLAILPLATREIRLWLDGSKDRVAVLHCKAGKGRSGTLACAYLLSLDENPTPPKLERSYTSKEWYDTRADEWIKVVEEEGVLDGVESTGKEEEVAALDSESGSSGTGVSRSTSVASSVTSKPGSGSGSNTPISRGMVAHSNLGESTPASRTALESVLALHTSRRMRASKSSNEKQKQGVSIPSQRRWLHYWSRILSGSAPEGFWSLNVPHSELKQKARITVITVRMKEPTGAKGQVVKVANVLLDRVSQFKSKSGSSSPTKPPKPISVGSESPIWISLARYDDSFVETLEKWEAHTRHGDTPGRRRDGSNRMYGGGKGEEGEEIERLFEDGKWDRSKMVRRFATFGVADGGGKEKEVEIDNTERGKILKYDLKSTNDSRWTLVKKVIAQAEHSKEPNSNSNKEQSGNNSVSGNTRNAATSEEEEEAISDEISVESLSTSVAKLGVGEDSKDKKIKTGAVVDARREIRAKMYLGKIPMGWFWFIPAFHLSQSESTTTLRLVRKEVDFPLGPGEWIVDVEIGMEWVAESAPGMPTGMGAVGSRVGEGEAEAEEKTPIREKERKVEVAKQKSAESDFV